MNDSAWRDDLDLAWDRLVQSSEPGALDDASADALTRLHRLQAAADAPLSGRTRRWVAPRRSKRAFRLPAVRFNLAHAYALLAALLVVTMSGAFSMSRGIGYSLASATPIPALGGPKLYRVNRVTGAWQAMDAQSLTDVPGGSTPGLAATPTTGADIFLLSSVSADGSTVVQYNASAASSAPNTYAVFDAKTMTVRSRINYDGPVTSESISADGSRLTLLTSNGAVTTGAVVFDTASGRQLSSLNLLSASSLVVATLIDSTATHAYVLSRVQPITRENSRDVVLIDYRLDTGEAVHQMILKNLLRDLDSGSVPLVEYLPNSLKRVYHGLPGFGLSPDDSVLAILSPSQAQLTVIRTSDWSSLSSLLVETDDNSNCYPATVDFYSGLTFVGDRIVATGFIYEPSQPLYSIDVHGSITCSIELPATMSNSMIVRATGSAVADLLPTGWYFRWTTLSTNGTDLYAIDIKESSPGASTYTDYGVFRLNPVTLSIEARADFPISNPSQAFYEGFLLAFAPPN